MIGEDGELVSGDNRGVSPVIGVILMVAITVILAAVIGGFVLGLGDSLQSAPQAQLDANYISEVGATGNDGVELSHNGGDAIAAGDLEIKFDSDSAEGFNTASNTDWTDQDFQVGDTAEFQADFSGDGEVRVQLIHTPSESILLDTTVES